MSNVQRPTCPFYGPSLGSMTVMSLQKDEGKEGRPIIHPQHERREGHEGDGWCMISWCWAKILGHFQERYKFRLTSQTIVEEWNQAKSKYIWIMESISNWDLFLLQAPNAAKNVHGWHWVRRTEAAGCPILLRPLQLPRLYELHEEYIFLQSPTARKNASLLFDTFSVEFYPFPQYLCKISCYKDLLIQ